jgi:HlyD family secretion protein
MSKKRGMMKWLIGGGLVVVVTVFVYLNLGQSERGQVTVQTKKIAIADVTSIVSGSGKVQPNTKVNVTAEVNAIIINIPVKEGDFVTRGQTLLQLDTVQLKKDLESAVYSDNELEAVLKGAKVALDQHKEEYERQKSLFEKKLTSEQAYKDAYYAYQSQQASYGATEQQKNAAQARLEKSRDNLGKTTVKAPMDGIVTLVDAEVGEIAQAQTAFTQGKTLMVVSDLSGFEVEVEIDETDIADVRLNQNAKVAIDAFPDTTFVGAVTEIGNTATMSGLGTNDQATNFKVKVALLEANERIRPGMSATVDITTQERKGAVTVPIQAVVLRNPEEDSLGTAKEKNDTNSGNVAEASTTVEKKTAASTEKSKKDKKGVFVNRDGKATFVEIKTGIADQQNYEVLDGLQVGDEVITGSFQTLRTIKSGASIKVDNKTQAKDKDKKE